MRAESGNTAWCRRQWVLKRSKVARFTGFLSCPYWSLARSTSHYRRSRQTDIISSPQPYHASRQYCCQDADDEHPGLVDRSMYMLCPACVRRVACLLPIILGQPRTSPSRLRRCPMVPVVFNRLLLLESPPSADRRGTIYSTSSSSPPHWRVPGTPAAVGRVLACWLSLEGGMCRSELFNFISAR